MKPRKIIATSIAVTLAALGAAAASNPGVAQATTAVVEGASPSTPNFQQIINESQEPTPNLTVPIHIGSCPGNTSPDGNSCTEYPDTKNQWPVPQIWMDPQQEAFVLLHELGHVSWWELDHTAETLNPIGEEFERIVGKPGWKWRGFGEEPYVNESPAEEWADTMLSCSWMGRVATGPTVTTPGYGFVLTASQYNEACAFFARVLVGPQFTQPTAAPLPPIPYNYTGSALCGARPELVKYCGHGAEPQGFGRPESRTTKRINLQTRMSAPRPKPRHTSKPAAVPAGATRITMHNPKQQAVFQSIVDRSQEPTPNLTITVHRENCPYPEAKATSCVAYPSPQNGWTAPQVWVSPQQPAFTVLGELGYVSWWELDPTTEATTQIAWALGEAFERTLGLGGSGLVWRPMGREDSNDESPARMWADILLSCSWMGRVARPEEGIETVGYGFEVPSKQYNAACAFFAKTLVGQGFSQPARPSLSTIPTNYSESPECGARPELVRFCGTRQGWEEGRYGVASFETTAERPAHKHHQRPKSKQKGMNPGTS